MKIQNKFIALACIGILCLSALTGCKKKGTEPETQSETAAAQQTEPVTEKQTESQKQTEPQTEPQSETQAETQTQSETQNTSSGETQGFTASGEERYFFDEAGNTIYTSQNENGDWVDKNGTVYTFLENGVKDSNGTQYYYDPPAYRDNGSGVTGTDTGEAVDLYRNDGTLVRLTKDANGNWADKNGITYTLRDDGAMDSNGEFHPL